jgi:isopentenyl phosphate kinase
MTNSPTPITFIKLGGSVVTFKNQAYKPRLQVLKRLIKEIKQAQDQTNQIYVIGHGQGSFAHIPAHKYQIKSGCKGKKGLEGLSKTRLAVIKLNAIVLDEFNNFQMPAVSFLVSQMAITRSGKLDKHNFSQLEHCLDQGLLPITTGDVLVDEVTGCTVWSTERVFAELASHLHRSNQYQVTKQIMVTDVDGVLDAKGQIIPQICPDQKLDTKQLKSSSCIDVTGGMRHKVESALEQAKQGVETVIVSGLKPGRLFKCLTNQACPHTLITK